MPNSASFHGARPLPSYSVSPLSTKSDFGSVMRRAGLTPGVASVVFSPVTVNVTVGGMAAFYSVVFRCSNAPEQAVTVSPVNLPTGLRVLPSFHVFTQDNWREPHFFRVAAVNGGVFEELRGAAAVIEHTTSSLDPRFHGRRVLHVPSAVQAHITPRDGCCLFATGKTAATASQQKLLSLHADPKSKQQIMFHKFTEIELRPAIKSISSKTTVEEPATAARATLDHSNALVKLTSHGDKTLALYNDGEMLALGSSESSSTSTRGSRRDSGTDAALSRMLLDVACGDGHVVGASEQGYLLTWGEVCETRPRNAVPSSDSEPTTTIGFPKVVQSLLHKRIVQVACGASHSFALAEDSDVFSWGLGRSGALGHGLNAHEQTFDSVSSPMEVLALKGRRVVQIACGDINSAALLLSGELLTCGQREHGRLGRQPTSSKSAGNGVTASGNVEDGECSSWFAPVAFPHNHMKCTYVACGAAHTLAVGGPHELYAFGWNSNGQLGIGDCRDRFVPTRVAYFDAIHQPRGAVLPPLNIASVAAGKLHSLVSSPDGRLYAWGNDEMGQCGLSSCPQIYTLPHLVTSLVGLRVTQLAAGEAHSAVLTGHAERHLETLERTQPTQYAQLVEHYENAVKDDSERRAYVLEHAKQHQLERAAAARRRKPPVDPATDAISKILLLQSLVDQDAGLDTKFAGHQRPQTARATSSRCRNEAEKKSKNDGATLHRVHFSSASMVRQARLAVLQAPLGTLMEPIVSHRPVVPTPPPKSKAPPSKLRPSSAASSGPANRRKPANEGQRQLAAMLHDQNIQQRTKTTGAPAFPPLTDSESGRRTPQTPPDKNSVLSQKSIQLATRRRARKLRVTSNVKLQELPRNRAVEPPSKPETLEDIKGAAHEAISSNQEDSVPSRNISSHETQRNDGKPTALEQLAQLILPNEPEQTNNNTLGSTQRDVPLQLLQGARVDLRRWSVIVSDRTLRRIAAHNHRLSNSCKAQRLQGLLPIQRRSSFLGKEHEVEDQYVDARYQATESLLLTGADAITDTGVAAIALAIPNLKELALAGAVRITDAALRVVGEYCTHLERLDLSALSGVRGAGLATLIDHCGASLTHLVLADCSRLGDWVLRRCLYASPRLTHLNLSRCLQVGDALIETLAAQCPLLRRLELSGCLQISDRGVVRIARHSPYLEYVALDRPIGVRGGEQLTDSSSAALGDFCPNLRFVSLAGSSALTDAGAQWMVSRCPQLARLDLTGAIGLTDATCAALGAGCPELRALRINGVKGISDVGLRLLAAGCPKLELLHAANLYLVSDGSNRDFGLEGLRAIASRCPELQDLNLSGCFQLQERALVAIGASCPELRRLSVQACPEVTLVAVTAVLKGCPRLTRLDISSVRRCDDRMMRVIAKHGSALTQLVVAGCDRVGDAGLRYLASSRADQLELLDFTGCRLISDAGINALCDAFQRPKLAHLVLAECPLITQDPIARLAFACPQLLTLSVHGCRVSARVLQSLSSSWPFGELRLPPVGTPARSNTQLVQDANVQLAYRSSVAIGATWLDAWLSIFERNNASSSCFSNAVLFECKHSFAVCKHCVKLRDDEMQSLNARLHNKRKLFDFYGRRRDYRDGTFPSIWPSEILQDAARGYDFEKLVPRDNYQDMLWEISRFVPVSTGNWDDELVAAKAAEAAASPAVAMAFATMLSEGTNFKPNDRSTTEPDIDSLGGPGKPTHHMLYREKGFDENGASLWESFYDYAQGEYRYYHRISKRVVSQPPGQ
ncbi:unnamed protein product [Phytophthora lilii]|uniref:Unnamed protein product n=1 Tax=Phytophthora lilii TaxID=2077276 RepID=A0A9W6TYD1_9STRA|nr:unnamed protein product [Phytophthora lilii]